MENTSPIYNVGFQCCVDGNIKFYNHEFESNPTFVLEIFPKEKTVRLCTKNKIPNSTVLFAGGSIDRNGTEKRFDYCSLYEQDDKDAFKNVIHEITFEEATKTCKIYCDFFFWQVFAFPKDEMIDDFGKFLDNKKLMDVTLVIGEHKFQAHKAILSARSSVFAAMFEHELEEKITNTVTITDIDHTVFEQMLFFIYKNDVPKLKEMHIELLAAADKYALNGLKRMCENSIFEDISIETAIETLSHADLHNADSLKKETLKYIAQKFQEVTNTHAWEALNDASLVKEILYARVQHTKTYLDS